MVPCLNGDIKHTQKVGCACNVLSRAIYISCQIFAISQFRTKLSRTKNGEHVRTVFSLPWHHWAGIKNLPLTGKSHNGKNRRVDDGLRHHDLGIAGQVPECPGVLPPQQVQLTWHAWNIGSFTRKYICYCMINIHLGYHRYSWLQICFMS